jgi:putative oxidoreductase
LIAAPTGWSGRRREQQVNDNGLSTGLIAIRLALGLMLVIHGGNKVLGAGGIAGTARWFEGLGLRPGLVHAWVAAATEVGAGSLMVLGLAFPAPCAGYVGLMTVAALTDHRGKGFFVFNGGYEYVALVAVMAIAVAFSGPGGWSLDRLLGLRLDGLRWGLAAACAGLAVGAGTVVAFRRPVAVQDAT